MNKKKLIAILTLMCFMFTLVPVAAIAEGETGVIKLVVNNVELVKNGELTEGTVAGVFYDLAANRLILKNAVLSEGCSYTEGEATKIAAIYVDGSVELSLEGVNTINGDFNRAIYVSGDLIVSGNGSLSVSGMNTGIKSNSITWNGTGEFTANCISAAMAVATDIEINQGTLDLNCTNTSWCTVITSNNLTFNGGNTTIKAPDSGYVYGTYIYGNTIINNGSVSSSAKQDSFYGKGGNYIQNGGTVIAPDGIRIQSGAAGYIEVNGGSIELGRKLETTGFITLRGGQIDFSDNKISAYYTVLIDKGIVLNHTTGEPLVVSGESFVCGEADAVYLIQSTSNKNIAYYEDGTVVNYSTEGSFKESCRAILNGGTFDKDTVFEAGELAVPQQEGKVFAGWYDNAAYEGTAVSTTEAGKTYYAKWIYDITFDGNRETSGSTDEMIGIAEGDTSTPLTTNGFTKNGYTFVGWNTKADGSGTTYADGAVVKPQGNTTLYAQWEGNPYTILFDGNGATEGTTPSALSMTYGTAKTLPHAGDLKKVDKKFVEWNQQADGNGTGYIVGNNVSDLTAVKGDEITLYAIWGDCDHTGSSIKSTCENTAVCSICGGTIAALGHDYALTWSKDDSKHWYACSRCDVNKDEAAHTFDWVIDQVATESETGLQHEKCTVCDAVRNVDTVIEKLPSTQTPSTSSSSGFSGSYNYPVSTSDVNNGSVKLSDSNAVEGESVTATVTPDNGYGVAEVIVTDEDGNIIPVEFIGNGQYTFVMPDGEVSIEVVCKPAITMKIGDTMLNIFGKIVKNDVAPTIGEGNRTMLPIRAVANALGAEVYWDADNQKVTIVKDGKVIEVFIGKDYAFVDGERIQLDAKAYIENDRTYLQVRFVTEALDAEVIWDPVTRMITIIPN